MNYRMISHTLGSVLACLAVLMLLPLLAGLCYGENVLAFVIAIGITAAVSFILRGFKPRSTDIYAREGFVIVGLAWISMSLLGALPFVISGEIPNYIDAVFETVSGFTTTGASILTDVGRSPRSHGGQAGAQSQRDGKDPLSDVHGADGPGNHSAESRWDEFF